MISDSDSPLSVGVGLASDGSVCVVLRIEVEPEAFVSTMTPEQTHELGQSLCEIAQFARKMQIGMSN